MKKHFTALIMSLEILWLYFFICMSTLSILLILIAYIIYKNADAYPKLCRYEEEKYFFDPNTGEKIIFPSLDDESSINISVIVPAYNEEIRLPAMMDECLNYLEQRKKLGLSYEVIIVSDGSTDKTIDVAHSYAKQYNTVRVLSLKKNRGKGGAVKLGMQSSRGAVLLFADADGATTFSDLEKLEKSLKNLLGFNYISSPTEASTSHAVVCGSRAHLEEKEKAKRSLFRLILMHCFHFLVKVLCVKHVHDTQCGFKMLTRASARVIFKALHIERWAFDVEMLYIAEALNLPVAEVAVEWQEIDGSKIVPFWSWLQMGKDLALISFRYKFGIWKIEKLKSS